MASTNSQAPTNQNPSNLKCLNVLYSIQPYLVEVAYFMFFLARHMSLPLCQEYVQSEIHRQRHLPLSESGLNLDRIAGNETLLYHEAQKETTVVVLSLQIAEGLPAVITVIILGALSDRTGRRRIMIWLPSLGSCVYCLIYILILYTGWSLDGLFMAAAFRGLSGSMTAVLAGGTLYAINTVQPEHRSSRLALQELLNGVAYALGNIMVGFWVQTSGYLQPFWFCFICSLIAFLVSFFLVKEIQSDGNQATRREISGNCCIDTFKPMAKFFKCRNNLKLVKIWLAIIAFQTYAVVHIGQINTLVLYLLGPPMGWPALKIGVFLCAAMAFGALCTGIVPPFFRGYLTEIHLVFAGFLSKAIGTLWLAVVQNDTVLYFSILLRMLEFLPFPMLRAIVAKGSDPAEQGSLFALMHSGESVSYFLAPLMFQTIYANTLHYFPGFVFVVSVILLIVPFGFTIGIRYLDLKDTSAPYTVMEGDSELIANEVLDDTVVCRAVSPSCETDVKTRETRPVTATLNVDQLQDGSVSVL